jgi:hypothetical protein
MEELSPELTKRPMPLVAFVGLTSLHAAISKLFSPVRTTEEGDVSDQLPISILLVDTFFSLK